MHNIPKVNELEEKAGYHIMRHDRMPSWSVSLSKCCFEFLLCREAHDNMNGGHWSMTCAKTNTVSRYPSVAVTVNAGLCYTG